MSNEMAKLISDQGGFSFRIYKGELTRNPDNIERAHVHVFRRGVWSYRRRFGCRV